MEHVCWTDDTLCKECGLNSTQHDPLGGFINQFKDIFGYVREERMKRTLVTFTSDNGDILDEFVVTTDGARNLISMMYEKDWEDTFGVIPAEIWQEQ
jgi:hypothetical protein